VKEGIEGPGMSSTLGGKKISGERERKGQDDKKKVRIASSKAKARKLQAEKKKGSSHGDCEPRGRRSWVKDEKGLLPEKHWTQGGGNCD